MAQGGPASSLFHNCGRVAPCDGSAILQTASIDAHRTHSQPSEHLKYCKGAEMAPNGTICPLRHRAAVAASRTEHKGNLALLDRTGQQHVTTEALSRRTGTKGRTWGYKKNSVCSHSVHGMRAKEVNHEENYIGQSVPYVVGSDLRRLRLQLGMTQAELGVALRLGEPTSAGRTIRRWEAKEEEPVPGPVQLALEVLAARERRRSISGNKIMDYIGLLDGEAHHMGEGVFVVFQEADGEVQTVVLTPVDLERMLSANKKGTLEGE